MGDNADASIELFGVRDWIHELDQLLVPLVVADLEANDATVYAVESLAYGAEVPICEALQAQQISYVFFQAGDHEHTATTRLFTPGLGEWTGSASADGEPLVAASTIGRILDELPEDSDDVWLREQLEVASAAPWRTHFARLRASFTIDTEEA